MKLPDLRRLGFALAAVFLPLGFAIPFVNGRAEKQRQSEAGASIRTIVIALRSYAADHGGTYPATLEDLVKTGLLPNKSALDGPKIPGWTNKTGFDYLVADLKDDYQGERWMIASQSHGPKGQSLVGLNDGSVAVKIGQER